MNNIVLGLAFLVDGVLFWIWLQRRGEERLYNLHVYRGERRFERVNGIAGMSFAMECAEDWFVAGAEKVVVCDEHGMCKRLFTRDNYEKEGSVYFQ
jgi:hypothetical protein